MNIQYVTIDYYHQTLPTIRAGVTALVTVYATAGNIAIALPDCRRQNNINYVFDRKDLTAYTVTISASYNQNIDAISSISLMPNVPVTLHSDLTKWVTQGQSTVVTPEQYGAVGDGVTDDTAAIQAMLASGNGNNIYFPAGTYLITDRIDLSNLYRAGFSICGDGELTTIECVGASAGFYCAYNSGVSAYDDHVVRVFEKMRLHGDGTAGQKLFNNAAWFITFRNVVFWGGDYGYYTEAGYVMLFDSCHFRTNVTAGVYMKNSTDATFLNCYFRGHYYETNACAVKIDGVFCEHTQFIGGAIEGNTGEAVVITSSVTAVFLVFQGVYFELDGYKNENIKSFDNQSTSNFSNIIFINSKISYNVSGDHISGDYNFGLNAKFINCHLDGFLYVDKVSIDSCRLSSVYFKSSTTDEPTILVESVNNSFEKGMSAASGYIFRTNSIANDSLYDTDCPNLVEVPFTYPMGCTVNSPAVIASGDSVDLGLNENAEITFDPSAGDFLQNYVNIGAGIDGDATTARFWSVVFSVDTETELNITCAGLSTDASGTYTFLADKIYRLVVLANRDDASIVSCLIYPNDAAGATMSLNAVYKTSLTYDIDINKMNKLLEGNFSMLKMSTKDIRVGGQISSINTTDSTSSTTGAIVSYGGLAVAKTMYANGRIITIQGADVESANDLTLGTDGVAFVLTGATTVNGIAVAGWVEGSTVRVYVPTGVTLKHNAAASTGFASMLFNSGSDYLGCGRWVSLTLAIVAGGSKYWYEINNSGRINVLDTTDATSKDTGSIITDGGIGVEKAIVTGTSITAGTSIATPKVMMTPEGGIAVKLTNKTGGNSVKGEVVTVYDDTAINNAVEKIVVDVPNVIGVFYESGIADGSEAWVVVSGIADVYFIGNTTRGHIARGFLTGDAGYVAGQALSEAYPTSPFSADKHFYEIGHVLESRTGAGLAKCVLHFN